jgi:hypothetical protein
MKPSLSLVALAALLLPLVAQQQQPAEQPEARANDEKLLREAGWKTDAASLLEIFRARTPAVADQQRMRNLVAELGARTFRVREQASAQLQKEGNRARPFLEEARQHADTEVWRRAALCLERIPADPEDQSLAAAARMVGRDKPAAAAGPLLAYLPFAPTREVTEAVQAALTAAASKDGQADPAVIDAAKDRLAVRRAAAGMALARVATARAATLKLLEDAEPSVRMAVALALVEARERAAVPVLIDLIPAVGPDQRWRVEDTLFQLAGEGAPTLPGDLVPQRDAWAAWWKDKGASVDLARVLTAQPQLGYTLVTYMAGNTLNGVVKEVDRDGKTRWQIGNLRYPVDAHVIGNNRVLIAEYLNRCVTERDFDGKILWQHQADLPIACQRLPGGRTFIATRRRLLVVDREGKEVFTSQQPAINITAAAMLPSGQFVVINTGGICRRLDAAGKELSHFSVGQQLTLGSGLEILPNGHILVPESRQNRVAEYDATGRLLWKLDVPQATSAVRLANGHTLVVSAQRRVVELTQAGKEVWSFQTEGRAWRARRR